MSEPVVYDCWPPVTPAHIDRLAALLHERHVERELTGGTRPAGMRLSTDCPVRRVKECLDPFWRIPFDKGIGARGHLMEDVFAVALLDDPRGPYQGNPYRSQVAINWGGGRSAFDYVVEHEARELVVSLKSTTTANADKMKPAVSNVRQEERMLALDGYPAGTEWHLWMIHPGTLQARGPFSYTLSQDRIDAARVELDRVTRALAYFQSAGGDVTKDPAWNDPAEWISLFGLESSSGAFRYASLDASGAIEARVRADQRARKAYAEAKREKEEAAALIRPHVEEQIALARARDPKAKSITAYGADDLVTYTLTTNGQMRVTTKPLEALNTKDAA